MFNLNIPQESGSLVQSDQEFLIFHYIYIIEKLNFQAISP